MHYILLKVNMLRELVYVGILNIYFRYKFIYIYLDSIMLILCASVCLHNRDR